VSDSVDPPRRPLRRHRGSTFWGPGCSSGSRLGGSRVGGSLSGGWRGGGSLMGSRFCSDDSPSGCGVLPVSFGSYLSDRHRHVMQTGGQPRPTSIVPGPADDECRSATRRIFRPSRSAL